MPHRLREEYWTGDSVYDHPLVSVTFLHDGKRIFIVQTYDDYLELKKLVTVTHEMIRFELRGGLYYTEMEGSDGSVIGFYVTPDSVFRHREMVDSEMSVNYIQSVYSVMCSLLMLEVLFYLN